VTVQQPATHDIADKLHSAAIHLLRSLRRVDSASGLSASRMSALSVVVFAGPVTLGRLAEAEQVTAPTMTRMVRGMESDGLVRRKSDDNDRRVVWITATAKGRKILQEGRERRIALLAEAIEGLSSKDQSLLLQATAAMTTAAKSIAG
jgi:DNA-binding MarR family transcriptional regulator